MNNLDTKIKDVFQNQCVYKSPKQYQIFGNRILPSFIKDWLIKRYTTSDNTLDHNSLIEFMNSHLVGSSNDVKRRITVDREEVQLLCRFAVETDVKNDSLRFAIPDVGIKITEGRIPSYIAKKNKSIKDGEHWGVIKMVYSPPCPPDKGVIDLIDFKSFQPYNVDTEYYKHMSSQFTFEEWIDVLIRAMEYNPDYDHKLNGFNSFERKLLFLTRLIVFVQSNLNLIELAPKGTGKSYVFSNLSKYGWMFSGGKVTRAKLFYDIGRKIPGVITQKDFVSFDEIETISFSDEGEMLGALKSYLESGKFSIANYEGTSSSGMMLLGNIPLTRNRRPINESYFSNLPKFFRSSALLDRFHGFLKGWDLVRISEDILLKGNTLNAEFFTEVLHKLRDDTSYSYIVSELLDIPQGADTRDKNAIVKMTTAYLKLFFPYVKSPDDVDKRLFNLYCLQP
ncbi:MAG: BREX system Lon protease-like protein BrxL, partial [Candidatus Delongbacteria bacterium]|nr:BREX system Lon protease-like protein BrxL [Candidatus Delongbacteria bacterium]